MPPCEVCWLLQLRPNQLPSGVRVRSAQHHHSLCGHNTTARCIASAARVQDRRERGQEMLVHPRLPATAERGRRVRIKNVRPLRHTLLPSKDSRGLDVSGGALLRWDFLGRHPSWFSLPTRSSPPDVLGGFRFLGVLQRPCGAARPLPCNWALRSPFSGARQRAVLDTDARATRRWDSTRNVRGTARLYCP